MTSNPWARPMDEPVIEQAPAVKHEHALFYHPSDRSALKIYLKTAAAHGVKISSDLDIPPGYVRTTCSLHPNFIEMPIGHLLGEDDRHG